MKNLSVLYSALLLQPNDCHWKKDWKFLAFEVWKEHWVCWEWYFTILWLGLCSYEGIKRKERVKMTPHYNDNGGSAQTGRLILVTWDTGVKLLLSTRQQTVIIYCECGHIYHCRGFTYAVFKNLKHKLSTILPNNIKFES